jgi:flagellar biosynthesis/type III secretory pathway M-ring protein FliF/YscJ
MYKVTLNLGEDKAEAIKRLRALSIPLMSDDYVEMSEQYEIQEALFKSFYLAESELMEEALQMWHDIEHEMYAYEEDSTCLCKNCMGEGALEGLRSEGKIV